MSYRSMMRVGASSTSGHCEVQSIVDGGKLSSGMKLAIINAQQDAGRRIEMGKVLCALNRS